MEMRNLELPPSPPKVIQALMKGFNAVANRVIVILIPVVFDLFLWLGPQLNIYKLVSPILRDMAQLPGQTQMITESLPMFTEFWQNLNLFAVLRTFPVGVFSLMSANFSSNSPLGVRGEVEISGFFGFLFWVLALMVCGWLAGTIYFYLVAQIANKEQIKFSALARSVLQGILLSGFWFLASMIVSLPLFVLMGILFLISPTLASLAYLIVAFIVLWLIVPIFFSGHGIFADSQNVFRSIWRGFRIMRYALPSLGWFALVAVVFSQGLNFLWLVPPADSWMTLVGIFGHAFISTALLAASFIYYRDLNVWIESALQWMKKRTNSVQA